MVTPTVPQRRSLRDATLRQWDQLGLPPIVVEQDPAWPLGHMSSRATACRALRAGLDTGADVIVFAEDDIDLDPRIPGILAVAADGDGPCSLWHRPRFRPAHAASPAGVGGVTVVRAKAARRWIGSLCVVLTAEQAARLLATASKHDSPHNGGIDIDLRDLAPIRITVPSLVAHRRLPRLASRGTHIDCDDYEGPRTDDAAGQEVLC